MPDKVNAPAVGPEVDYCAACRKPFNEVHPMDWMNDSLVCAELHEGPGYRDKFGYALRGVCTKNHTWREHVEESYDGKWINPHFRISEKELQ